MRYDPSPAGSIARQLPLIPRSIQFGHIDKFVLYSNALSHSPNQIAIGRLRRPSRSVGGSVVTYRSNAKASAPITQPAPFAALAGAFHS